MMPLTVEDKTLYDNIKVISSERLTVFSEPNNRELIIRYNTTGEYFHLNILGFEKGRNVTIFKGNIVGKPHSNFVILAHDNGFMIDYTDTPELEIKVLNFIKVLDEELFNSLKERLDSNIENSYINDRANEEK